MRRAGFTLALLLCGSVFVPAVAEQGHHGAAMPMAGTAPASGAAGSGGAIAGSAAATAGGGQNALMNATPSMPETPMSFNLQHMQVQGETTLKSGKGSHRAHP